MFGLGGGVGAHGVVDDERNQIELGVARALPITKAQASAIESPPPEQAIASRLRARAEA